MSCSCKSSSSNVTAVKQVVKKTKVKATSTNSKKIVIPQRTVSRKISYRRPI